MTRVTADRNPYRVQRVEALLRFRPQGTDWPALRARLAHDDLRGAIVGPHGSGKTTLLTELARQLRDEGRRVREVFSNRQSAGDVDAALPERLAALAADEVLLVDGYGHFGLRRRRWLRRLRCAGLIVTAHRRTRLPTLLRTRTDVALLASLVDALADDGFAAPDPDLLDALHRRHRGNVRDALLELYDRAARGELSRADRPTKG